MNDIKTPEELLDFMSNNINYGYLGKNGRVYHFGDIDFDSSWYREYILENSNDLFSNLYGNCWDQVEFERDWFLKNNYIVKTIYEMVKLDYDNDYPSHSFLIYKDNDYWCWFENADFNNRGIHKYDTLSDLLNDQYKKYVEYLKTFNIKKEELKKIIVREFDKPMEHISAKEYLDFVTNSKIVIVDEIKKDFLNDFPVLAGEKNNPYIILFDAYTGEGKSYVSKIISKYDKSVILNNDEIRKWLSDYSDKSKLKDELQKYRLELLLKNNNSCIMDSCFCHNWIDKKKYYDELGYKYYIIRIICSEDTVINRLNNRVDQYSLGSVKDYLWMKENVSHVDDNLIDFVIDTEKDVDKQVLEFLKKYNLI